MKVSFNPTPERLQQIKTLLSKQHNQAIEQIESKVKPTPAQIGVIVDTLGQHTEAVSTFLHSTVGHQFTPTVSYILTDIASLNNRIAVYVETMRDRFGVETEMRVSFPAPEYASEEKREAARQDAIAKGGIPIEEVMEQIRAQKANEPEPEYTDENLRVIFSVPDCKAE